MTDAAARETERLAISTAQARVLQALEALEQVPDVLDLAELADKAVADAGLSRLYRSLQRRLDCG